MNNNDIVSGTIGKVRYFIFNAGSFYSDGGASYGILPKAVWSKETVCDENNRIELACNLLLIRSEDHNILIDSGIGNPEDERLRKIYAPQPSRLPDILSEFGLARQDIDLVILTHLHHDHIGGLLTGSQELPELMFPQAVHYIQQKEWDMARNPDELNSGAYYYQLPLDLLQASGQFKLIDGDYTLTEEIDLILAEGHSCGSQMVRLSSGGELLYYPGDILPQTFHLSPAVTSAYDLSREETLKAKLRALSELKEKRGLLVFNHQTKGKTRRF